MNIPADKVEREIVELFEAGDERAMELVADQYGDVLYGIVIRMVRDKTLTRDIIQEAFLKIWQHSVDYSPKKGRLFTWMIEITRHTAQDALSKTRIPDDEGEDFDSTFEKTPFLSDSADRKLENQLTDKERSILEEVYILGFSPALIAEKYGLTLEDTQSNLRQAVRKLSTLFQDER